MTWTAFLVIMAGILFKMLTSPPSALVEWVLSKFALHPKLDPNEVIITFNGVSLDGEDKSEFIDFFNDAVFLERNHIYPGNEEKFLHPETNIIPFVINVIRRNKEVNFFVYCEDDNIFVVKQKKKKITSYSLKSESLKVFTI
ncbi:YfmQ family protein [Ureibacillus aquaedulcis]|uniref:YfmQ family protein n=1 Tax=Ureibacillus aquaedulcis TaxID=3058421 RepID=A0ABT8GX83_9BACL|nr:YfmQ family protein [Ureibacillus sp. BA0131]MDN4495551.1 YfmQ family protein [Ureibacillus sp. BA0131]